MTTESPISHQPELQGKINHACLIIEQVLDRYKTPCILSSFGKDSMLMLWMIREWFRKDIPVVFFRNPYFIRKSFFAEQQAAEMELELHANIPPVGVSLTSRNGKTELVQHFAAGAKHILMPIGRQSIEKNPRYLCAEQTLFRGPFGSFQWNWDVAFCGHKASDVDPVQESVPLQVDIHQIAGGCDMAYPLRYFTDEDVWQLTKAYNIPFNALRYGSPEAPNNDSENFWNADYLPYCCACMDPNEEEFVQCPKTGLRITNIHQSLVRSDLKFAYCGGK